MEFNAPFPQHKEFLPPMFFHWEKNWESDKTITQPWWNMVNNGYFLCVCVFYGGNSKLRL